MFVCRAAFSEPLFWSRSMRLSTQFHEKIMQKRGSCTEFCRGSGAFPGPRLCHLAEVVSLSSNGDCGATPLSVCLVATQLVTCTCGATCPRGFLSSNTYSSSAFHPAWFCDRITMISYSKMTDSVGSLIRNVDHLTLHGQRTDGGTNPS